MAIGPSANHRVEVEAIETETVKVRILPDGRMDRNNAARHPHGGWGICRRFAMVLKPWR
jgi:hypothetical protein